MCYSDADSDFKFTLGYSKWFRNRLDDPSRYLLTERALVARARDSMASRLHHRAIPRFDDHNELIAAHASHRVAIAQCSAKARRHFYEDCVTRGVTRRVIDILEAVEITVENRDLSILSRAASQGRFESVQ